MLQEVNIEHARARPDDAELWARIATYDTARGMIREAPEVLDVRGEQVATRSLYGVVDGDMNSFGYQCLIARRLIERGVRVVELIDTGSNNNWDAHGDMQDHRPKAARVDRAIAALIKDLKARAAWPDPDRHLHRVRPHAVDRRPWHERSKPLRQGVHGVLWPGLECSGGFAHGATDEHGINIVADPVHVHDYHATILHLMGIDHTRLVYRYAGRDFRLTDVDGKVVHQVLT